MLEYDKSKLSEAVKKPFAGYELRKWHPDKGDTIIKWSHDLRALDAMALEFNNALREDDEHLYHVEEATQPMFEKHTNSRTNR